MATNVLLPQWGMNMEDGLLVKWLVKEGDSVEEGQPLVEVETAKINSELEAPASGVVAHILGEEGATVDVGTIVAVIAEPGEEVPRPTSARPQRVATTATPAASAPASASGKGKQVTPIARRLAREHDVDLDRVEGTGPKGRVVEEDVRRAMESQKAGAAGTPAQVVPRARLLAKENGIDLSEVRGSGPNGRILVADVEQAIIGQGSAQVAGVGEVVKLTGLRKTIADRMMHSVQTVAPVTLTTEADVTEAVRLRESLVSEWRPHRIRPVDQDIIVKAVASALKEHPRVNATIVGDEIRMLDDINVGTAMAIPDGLLVPVIKNADEMSLLSIAQKIRELADKTRKGALTIDDMTNASFTITSLANYDIDAFTPIIDPPQVAILGVGRIVEKPAVYQGEIAVRSMMYLSLTFNHRAIDGVPSGEFLRAVKSRLEDVSWLESETQDGEA